MVVVSIGGVLGLKMINRSFANIRVDYTLGYDSDVNAFHTPDFNNRFHLNFDSMACLSLSFLRHCLLHCLG
jgi:hypothetical protein